MTALSAGASTAGVASGVAMNASQSMVTAAAASGTGGAGD